MNEILQSEVVLNKRPLRFAFLIPSDVESDLLDRIFEYCNSTWGGAFFPIIPTDGETIKDEYKQLLDFYDPDIIESFVELSDEILLEIDRFINPYIVTYQEKTEHWYEPHNHGLGINPTAKLLSETFYEWGKFVYWEFGKDADPLVKSFIKRNFGTHSRYDLPEEKRKVFENIVSLEDLSNALSELGGQYVRSSSYLYQSQLSALTKDIPNVEHQKGLADCFSFVIGNGSEDLAYFQNKGLNNSEWLRKYIRQVWIPEEFLENQKFVLALSDWAKTVASGIGNNTYSDLRFTTLTLNADDIAKKCQNLLPEWRRKHVPSILSTIDVPKYSYSGEFQEETYFINGSEGKIILNKDNTLPSSYSHPEYFMIDVNVQYRPDLYTNYSNSDGVRKLWWQFPFRNSIVHSFFGHSGRIRKNRVPSILVTADDTDIKVKIPNESEVFNALLFSTIPHSPREDDQRIKIWEKRKLPTKEVSPNGKYLSRFVKRFGGLVHCTEIFEESFWRKFFDELSYKNEIERQEKDIEEIIQKTPRSKQISLIKRKAQELANSKYSQKDISWDDGGKNPSISKMFDDEVKGLKLPPKHTDRQKKHIQERIDDFLGMGILELGILPVCKRCKFRNWFTIKEIDQVLECKGCGYSFVYPVDEVWRYRFDSALQQAYQQGILPEILILKEYLEGRNPFSIKIGGGNGFQIFPQRKGSFRGNNCFYWSPPSDLYIEGKKETDFDILCVYNGLLVVGEVKESVSRLTLPVIRDFCNKAKEAFPDVIIFSAFENKPPSKKVLDEIKKQNEALNPLGITVAWESFNPMIFNSTRHF